MEVGATLSSVFRPEVARTVFLLSATFWLTATSASDPEEPVLEVTTEGFEFPTFETTVNVTESPDDNGMAIGDIPREINATTPSTAPESKEEEPSAGQQQSVLVSFPDNHKNFTPSQYLGDQDLPPYDNHLSSYQQQYKNYNEQKEMYSRKPIKFEENSFKNFYLPANSLDLGDQKTGNGHLRVNRNPNPFPYTFDNEQTWQKDQQFNARLPPEWYKIPSLHDNAYQVNENAPEDWYKHVRGHQETPLYAFPHSYPQEDKFYHQQLLHADYHPVKKEEKPNPWKKVFHVLTALVPVGLLLATLTPNVISINSTATTKTNRKVEGESPLRFKEEDESPFRFKEEDVVRLMKKYGVESLTEAQCEDRILCELASEGSQTSAGPIEKGFWLLANQTPRDIAEKAGMSDLFKAIRTSTCDTYKCHAKVKRPGHAKKLTWKQKTSKHPSPPQ